MKDLEMIRRQQKAAFLRNIIEMQQAGWEPMWETFRVVAQSKPILGKQTDKFDYFILLKK